MIYTVSAADARGIKLNEVDTARSVLQNVAMILATRQQTVPLYRSFGLPQKFVDKPIPAAKPLAIAEVKEAVEEFEPRATVLSVTFSEDTDNPGRLIPTVEVEIHE